MRKTQTVTEGDGERELANDGETSSCNTGAMKAIEGSNKVKGRKKEKAWIKFLNRYQLFISISRDATRVGRAD